MDVVANYKQRRVFEEMWAETNYRLYMCPVCDCVTLESDNVFSEDVIDTNHLELEEQDEMIEKAIKIRQLYPENLVEGDYMPLKVQKAFEAAVKVKNIDLAICVLSLRRALEIMCKDKGAIGKNLFEKLKDLEKKNILPHIMKEVAIFLKDEGNSAAHGDDVKFSAEKVRMLINFTKTIFNYVYILPGQLNEAQTNISTIES